MKSPKDAVAVRRELAARAQSTGEDMQQLLERYVVERFLYRLSRSDHASSMILKGAVLFSAWLAIRHRHTRDVDFTSLSQIDVDQASQMLREICSIPVENDGVSFHLDRILATDIRAQAKYAGVRLMMPTTIGRARVKLQIDIGFGDVTTPAPQIVELPTVIDSPAPKVLAISPATVVAEKLETIVKLGSFNSRMKDYFDLRELARALDHDMSDLVRAVRATFNRRGTDIPLEEPEGLSSQFATDHEKQIQWSAFLRRIGRPSEPFSECVSEVAAFTVPILNASLSSETSTVVWRAGNGWSEPT